MNASVCNIPVIGTARRPIDGDASSVGRKTRRVRMDPTMGQAVTGQATFGGGEEEENFHQPTTPGMSAYLSVADMQADQAGGTEASGVVATELIIAEVE